MSGELHLGSTYQWLRLRPVGYNFALPQVRGQLSWVDVTAQHVPVALDILPQSFLLIFQRLQAVIHLWLSSLRRETIGK